MKVEASRTINEIIDGRPLSRLQWMTIALCGFVLFLDGFDTQSIGFLVPPIAAELGIPASSFGPVFGAGMFGLMFGTLLGGPVADRWGRKGAIVLSSAAFGVFTLATSTAETLEGLIVYRFLTGLGLGGAMPNVVALATEYAPARLQSTLVTLMFGGMGAGAVLSGAAGAVLLPSWGWRSVLYVGGLLPLLLVPVLVRLLPESVRFLAVRAGNGERIAQILGRMSPDLATVALKPPPEEERVGGFTAGHLFKSGRAVGTVLLWIPYFMNLLLFYFILSWLPVLLTQVGMPVSAGIAAVTIFSVGNIIGSSVQGRAMAVFGAAPTLLVEFLVAVLAIGLLGTVLRSYGLMLLVTLIIGICVPGAQAGLNALAAMFYPTAIRSTGVGWALGFGRVGSIVGPVIGGLMLARGWTPQQIFAAGIIPAACAATAIAVSVAIPDRASPYRAKGHSRPVENDERRLTSTSVAAPEARSAD